MSDEVMDLWSYRQALYCDAAKWVAGDIGKPTGSQVHAMSESPHGLRAGALDRAREMAIRHGSGLDGYAPGSIAGVGYTLSFGRKKAFHNKGYGGRHGGE